jgi:hypothetical protein
MYLFKKATLLSFFVIFSACNIRPIYYQNALKAESSKSFIQISAIQERLGQELRNMLTERLHFISDLEKTISIHIGLQSRLEGIGYNPDLSSSVSRIILTATTRITNKNGYKKVFIVEKSDIVTIPRSIYASLVNEDDIKRKILREIANNIIQRITILQKEM